MDYTYTNFHYYINSTDNVQIVHFSFDVNPNIIEFIHQKRNYGY